MRKKTVGFMIMLFALFVLLLIPVSAASVAQVNDTTYTDIDEAVKAWVGSSNTTLTLLSDVTLTSTIQIPSNTTGHVLNLDTFTMTAAANSHAIEIVETSPYCTDDTLILTVNADSTSPGGISCSEKYSCIYYYNSDEIDKIGVVINGGTFTGGYGIHFTMKGTTYSGYLTVNGGTFQCSSECLHCNLVRTEICGGIFIGANSFSVDKTAKLKIRGGKFQAFPFTTTDDWKASYPERIVLGSTFPVAYTNKQIENDTTLKERLAEYAGDDSTYPIDQDGNYMFYKEATYDSYVYMDADGYYCVEGTDKLSDKLSSGYFAASVAKTDLSIGKCRVWRYLTDQTVPFYFVSFSKAVESTTVGQTVTLLSECPSMDYSGNTLTIDLNGSKLTGTSSNASNITITNTASANATLAAIGTYANDVSSFAADGFSTTSNDTNTLFASTSPDVFSVSLEVQGTDRSTDTEALDLYVGDTVTVSTAVHGARFIAARVVLTYDKEHFQYESSTTGWTADTENGTLTYFGANTEGNYSPDGTSLGTITFSVLATQEAVSLDDAVTSNQDTDNNFKLIDGSTYVSGAWSLGTDFSGLSPIPTANLFFTYANIQLQYMVASVSPALNLTYSGVPQTLVQFGCAAKNVMTNETLSGATIRYAVLTKAQANGTVQKTDADGNPLYLDEYNKETTTVTDYPVYLPAETPDDSDYSESLPQKTDAGDYVVFCVISVPGFQSVSDRVSVNIDTYDVQLDWSTGNLTAVTDALKDNQGQSVAEMYYTQYTGNNLAVPTATYSKPSAVSGTGEAVIRMDSPDSGIFRDVGSYRFIAEIDSNYNIVNPVLTVLVDGDTIRGYSMLENESVWFDGKIHLSAELLTETDATDGIAVTWQASSDNGETWSSVTEEAPKLSAVGTYLVRATLSKDGYYSRILEKTYNINGVAYLAEKSDYITGWDLVLVYTDYTVPGFTYNGEKMFDMTSLGYRYANQASFRHVYGILVQGNANLTYILPSNESAYSIDNFTSGVQDNRYDVNHSHSVDINDLVAVSAVYNVRKEYLTAEYMKIVLKADVDGNKLVDTCDCSLIKSYSA